MSERRRFVTVDDAGTVTTVLDVQNGGNYQHLAGSFHVKSPERRPILAEVPRRYAGATVVDETHGNAEIGWSTLVQNGASIDAVLGDVGALIGAGETPYPGLMFEWRPDGASASTFFEIRGPATWQANYDWHQLVGANAIVVDVSIPVAPLGRGLPSTITFATAAAPRVVQLSSAIAGEAPALADIDITFHDAGGGGQALFGLVGWTQRPSASGLSLPAPFGVLQAEAGTGTGGAHPFATAAETSFMGSSGRFTDGTSASVWAAWDVDASTVQPDDFSRNEIDVEVWARVRLASDLVSPRAILSLNAGVGGAVPVQYTPEFGTAGRLLTVPSSGSANRLTRLGTLRMPTDDVGLSQKVRIDFTLAGVTAGGTLGLDYILLVPSRQRALTPTGVAWGSGYPGFLKSSTPNNIIKTIRHDLSGRAGTSGAQRRDSGLGGSVLELPTGNVDVLIALASVVPDDPTSSTATDDLSAITISGQVRVTPRYWLAK